MPIFLTQEHRDFARGEIECAIRRGYNLRRLVVTQEELDELGIVYDGEVLAYYPGRMVTWDEYYRRTGKDY